MIVIHDVSREPPLKGDLFAGCQFFIAQRCPSRSDLLKRVTYNGGAVVLNERHARYVIVDHERKDPPRGALSYRFILDSIDKEQLEDEDNHRCGPPVGSARNTASARPPRHGRVPFSAQDDADIYRYVKSCERRGCAVKGNEIYKEFAEKHPRHTFNSWRDRYIKYLSEKPPLAVSGLTPSPEPRPSKNLAESIPQKTTTATSAKSTDSSPASGFRPKSSSERRHAHSPAKTNGKTGFSLPTQSSDEPPAEAPKPAPSSPARPSYCEGLTTFTSKKMSNSVPRLNKISFGGSPSATDSLCSDLPASVDQFQLADFPRPVEAGRAIQLSGDNKDIWVSLAGIDGNHTAEEWRDFWEKCVWPICQRVGSDEKNRQIYDKSLQEFETEVGADANIRKWVSYFREKVAPKLRKLPTGTNEKTGNEHSGEQQEIPRINGNLSSSDHEEGAQSPSPRPSTGVGSWNLDGNKSSPVRSCQTKRSRRNDSEAENQNETPPAKRPRLTSHFDESEGKIHDSIEFSPTKKLASSPLGERNVIHIGSERSSSSPSDLFVRNSSLAGSPGVHDASEAELEQYESQDLKGQSSQEKEEHVRKVIGGLDDHKVTELLELLRTAPSALQEPDDMTPFEAAVMRALDVFNNNVATAADWEQFNKAFYLKSIKLGIEEQLFSDGVSDDSDADDEEDEEQREQHVANQVEGERQDENEALESAVTNGDIPHEPTERPGSPRRSVTPQLYDSNDTIITFDDSATRIDNDDTQSDYPIDLTTEDEAQAYITSRLGPPWAFSEAEILVALHATCSNSTALADLVLCWMRQNDPTKDKGKGKERSRGRRSSIGPGDKFLPAMPGVWTEDDDEAALGLANPEEEQRIVQKHGSVRCRQRRAFLMSFE